MNDPFALTEESIARAVKAHDALMTHCADRAMRLSWQRVRRDEPWAGTLARIDAIPGHSERVGDPSYEPSQPAPTHNPALWWALAIVLSLMAWGAAIAAVVGIVRKIREPIGMACFALIIAAVALVVTR